MPDMPVREKEVYYFMYCAKCEYYERAMTAEPCNHCLHNPSNQNSHKPVDFKEKET